MKPVIIHSEARAELDDAIAFYHQQKPGLGMDLIVAVERAIAMIQQNPQIGARYKATELRRHVMSRFPYVIFYGELTDALWIVAVAHGKRRPGYWSRRRLE